MLVAVLVVCACVRVHVRMYTVLHRQVFGCILVAHICVQYVCSMYAHGGLLCEVRCFHCVYFFGAKNASAEKTQADLTEEAKWGTV